jgi:hypothetical protein
MSADMNFGRRPPSERDASTSGSEVAPHADAGNGGGGLMKAPLVRQLCGILVVVGIVLFLGAVYVVSMKGFGKASVFRAGVFRIKDFTQDQDAVAIFVLKGGTALRPCRKSDVAAR